jgi:hypothetical protein
VAVAVMAVRAHPAAAISAAVYGFLSAVGLVAVHLLPRWSSFLSDPYAKAPGLDWLSWTIVYLQVVMGLLMAGVAVVIMVRRRAVMGPPADLPLDEVQPEPA